MDLAESASKRANCLGKKVGAIIVLGNRVVATGYNGVPEGMTNCLDGGCHMCLQKYKKRKSRDRRKNTKSGKGYDECICVHAEQNVLMTSARHGISIEGGIVYTTYQPCFTCLKQMLQAKIIKIYFKKELYPFPDRRLKKGYIQLQNQLPEGMWKVSKNGVSKRFYLK